MAKNTSLFECQTCGAQFQKWVGRCLECGAWGMLKESVVTPKDIEKKILQKRSSTQLHSLTEVDGKNFQRLQTTIAEVDSVLGGGIVPGSFVLLGGEPGIGKSTLALQLAVMIPETLYISGEESIEQIKLRADRLMSKSKKHSVQVANETCVETIIATLMAHTPAVAVIDSIQTMYSEEVESEPGSVSQVRTCAVKLLACAKSSRTAIIVIGHVTKDGMMAGPRTLEHLVDTVLYLEGDRFHTMRLLRAVKNRFGSTDEVGMFMMEEHGLVEVPNPSALLLEERGEGMSGSVVTCLMEGTRPLLIEVQALVNKTNFGYPVRKASGFDINRLHVLIAVLERRVGLPLGQYDVHINVVGGVKANEPAADLAICLAIASAFKNKILGNDLAAFGEVGLGGEVRSVRLYEKRLKECAHIGMKRVITSRFNAKEKNKGDIHVIGVKNIEELISHV